MLKQSRTLGVPSPCLKPDRCIGRAVGFAIEARADGIAKHLQIDPQPRGDCKRCAVIWVVVTNIGHRQDTNMVILANPADSFSCLFCVSLQLTIGMTKVIGGSR